MRVIEAPVVATCPRAVVIPTTPVDVFPVNRYPALMRATSDGDSVFCKMQYAQMSVRPEPSPVLGLPVGVSMYIAKLTAGDFPCSGRRFAVIAQIFSYVASGGLIRVAV